MSNQFKLLTSSFMALPIENIDTDQIIPARFLKTTQKTGLGENVFRDWRYDSNNNLVKDFPLNDATLNKDILVAGKNFGCGSSREHAAWALTDFGFKVVISSFFGDIFKNNALNNRLLVIQVSDDFLEKILLAKKTNHQAMLTINVEAQTLTIDATKEAFNFDINPYKKECIINGYDDIDYLLSLRPQITTFEQTHFTHLKNI